MDIDLKIQFGKSSSQNYQRVINQAKKFSCYLPVSETSSINIIHITNPEELRNKYKVVESIWEITRSWKSFEFILNNEVVGIKEIRDIFRILECAENYTKSIIPDKHCNLWGDKEGWGCKYLDAIDRHLDRYYYSGRTTYWYKFGHFANSDTWKIHKKELRKAIEREVELKRVFLCNIFDFKKVENIIDSLPDVISLKDSEDWSILYEETTSGSIIEKKPIGIQHDVTQSRTRGGLSYGLNISMSDLNEKEEKEVSNKKERNIPDVKFSDIGGIEDIIEVVREVIELPLIKPEIFTYLGIEPHRGILLYGPPGCGKTMIAKAIANEINAHFILINGPELLSKWYGESEANLRSIFHEAKNLKPSIIYWDEIDSLTQSRTADETLRLESRIVNQLLTLMDGVEEFGDICVIASTNRKDLLDEALLRPGRFDYCIEITKPSPEGCFKIFSIATKGMPIEKKFDKRKFAKRLFGLSGADISFIAREGAYNCLRRSLDLRKMIGMKELRSYNFDNLVIKEEDFNLAFNKISNYNKTNVDV